MKAIEENIHWIQSGKIGCTFATALIKQRDKIGWKFIEWPILTIPSDAHVLSIVLPNMSAGSVRDTILGASGFYIESVGKGLEGLRYKAKEGISWVQYFGPDSHVKTRQSPHPMLVFTIKHPTHVYAKTMAKGILHLAHASIEFLTGKKCNRFWETSHKRSRDIIGHELGESEGAKVTFKM